MSEENNIELDQFFTKPERALELYDKTCSILDIGEYDILLEPSVGANSLVLVFQSPKGF